MSERFVKGLHAVVCAHDVRTPEDGSGRAVCVRCGAVVSVRLTSAMLREAFVRAARMGRGV